MNKNWYQIDRRNDDGTLASCEMIQAQSLDDALRKELGTDYADYTISRRRINGSITVKAECPAETASYVEVCRAAR
jgi:hypothetical protein